MGDITINITNGKAPYHVELIPDIGTSWNFGSSGIKVLSPVPAGEYTVKVTDDNGCVVIINGVIIETTTTTTQFFCEEPMCETVLTVGYLEPYYGYGDGIHSPVEFGSISPDCGDMFALIYTGAPFEGLGLISSNCYSIVTVYINGTPYEMSLIEGGEGEYTHVIFGVVSNPFPSIGETCSIIICGNDCTTTTTTTLT